MILKDKKVLVTGACGFIGSHLVEELLLNGCEVKAFVYYNSFNSWGWLDSFPTNILKEIEIFTGDIRDSNSVRSAVKGVSVIFHLAALIGIPYSYYSPESYIETNIKGTLNVLQSCRDFDLERLIVTSTSEVYGTARYVPIDEYHPLQPQSPYSASKIGADCLAESFFRSFNLPVIIARPFNTYGPRQSARAIIPTIITQLLSGAEQIELGSLKPSRDFNFVKDVCRGFVALAQSDKAVGRTVNIGTGEEISIGKLAQKIIGIINPDVNIHSKQDRKRPENSEVERLVCNNMLLKELTPWTPETTFEQGLAQTIIWFKDTTNLKRYKWNLYNV